MDKHQITNWKANEVFTALEYWVRATRFQPSDSEQEVLAHCAQRATANGMLGTVVGGVALGSVARYLKQKPLQMVALGVVGGLVGGSYGASLANRPCLCELLALGERQESPLAEQAKHVLQVGPAGFVRAANARSERRRAAMGDAADAGGDDADEQDTDADAFGVGGASGGGSGGHGAMGGLPRSSYSATLRNGESVGGLSSSGLASGLEKPVGGGAAGSMGEGGALDVESFQSGSDPFASDSASHGSGDVRRGRTTTAAGSKTSARLNGVGTDDDADDGADGADASRVRKASARRSWSEVREAYEQTGGRDGLPTASETQSDGDLRVSSWEAVRSQARLQVDEPANRRVKKNAYGDEVLE